MSRQSALALALAAALAVTLAFALRPLAAGGPASGVAAATPNAAVPGDARPIAVTGEGRIRITPDIAMLTFGVETNGTDLATAQADNAKRTQATIDRLKGLGIAEADLQTVGYNVVPQYDRDGRPTGYRVINGVRATIRDLAKVGPTIDAAIAAGANRVSSIAFDVANKEDATRRAREAAVADARAKAEHYAKLTGVTLGGPLTISENVAEPQYRTEGAPAAAPAAGGATPIEPGQGTITVTVQISYEMR